MDSMSLVKVTKSDPGVQCSIFQTYEVCTGSQLACSNEILNRIGQFNKASDVEQTINQIITNKHWTGVNHESRNI